MAIIRGTFFFKDQNGAGWSSTVYNTAANLTAAVTVAKNLVPLWVQLLGEQSGLYEVRVSDDQVKRDSQILINDPGSVSPAKGSASNFASDDVVCRIEGTNLVGPPFTVRRTLALRGTPVNITGPAGTFVGEPGWNNRFKAFVAQLIKDGWAIRYRDKTVPIFAITSVVQDLTTGLVTVGTALPNLYVAGDGIAISRVLGAPQVNGQWIITAIVDANHFKISTTQIVAPYLGGGFVNKNAYALAAINSCIPIRMATHKAGRPFDELRGRRSRRTRR
jgi:hypothetical protein